MAIKRRDNAKLMTLQVLFIMWNMLARVLSAPATWEFFSLQRQHSFTDTWQENSPVGRPGKSGVLVANVFISLEKCYQATFPCVQAHQQRS